MKVYSNLNMNGAKVENAPNLITSPETPDQKIVWCKRAELNELIENDLDDPDTEYHITDDESSGEVVSVMQLGNPVTVSFPFLAPSDGLLSFTGACINNSVNCTLKADDVIVKTFVFNSSYNDFTYPVNKGKTYTVSAIGGNDIIVMNGKFTPFVQTTAKPVDQTFNPESLNPQSGVAVAEALVNSKATKTTLGTVKVPDGNFLSIDANGVIKNKIGYALLTMKNRGDNYYYAQAPGQTISAIHVNEDIATKPLFLSGRDVCVNVGVNLPNNPQVYVTYIVD